MNSISSDLASKNDKTAARPRCSPALFPIFVCGFSAAGHLCCSLGEFWNQEFVYGAIGKTPEVIRPSGLILCYPVITAGGAAHRGSFDCLVGEQATKEELDQVSLELHVHKDMPKTFIWQQPFGKQA